MLWVILFPFVWALTAYSVRRGTQGFEVHWCGGVEELLLFFKESRSSLTFSCGCLALCLWFLRTRIWRTFKLRILDWDIFVVYSSLVVFKIPLPRESYPQTSCWSGEDRWLEQANDAPLVPAVQSFLSRARSSRVPLRGQVFWLVKFFCHFCLFLFNWLYQSLA